MAVLKRELAAYQKAVDRYNQALGEYNTNVSRYNQSLVTDKDGNPLVRDKMGNLYAVGPDGKLIGGIELANGKTVADYGATAIQGDDRFLLMRQNPMAAGVETVRGALASYNDNGQITGYYTPNSEGGGQPLGSGWKVVSTQGPTSEGGSTTYTLERDASNYMDKPAEFKGKINMAKPDPSIAQARRLMDPGLAARERGLIGEVIRGGGVTEGTSMRMRNGAMMPGINQAVATREPPSIDPGAVPGAPNSIPVPPTPNFAVPSGDPTPAYPTSTPGTAQFQQDLTNYLGNSYVTSSQNAVNNSLSTLSNQISSGYYGTPAVPAYTPAPAPAMPAFDYAPAGFGGFYFGF